MQGDVIPNHGQQVRESTACFHPILYIALEGLFPVVLYIYIYIYIYINTHSPLYSSCGYSRLLTPLDSSHSESKSSILSIARELLSCPTNWLSLSLMFFFFFLRDFIFKKTLFEKLQYLKQDTQQI